MHRGFVFKKFDSKDIVFDPKNLVEIVFTATRSDDCRPNNLLVQRPQNPPQGDF
jgi:hypothetical protein